MENETTITGTVEAIAKENTPFGKVLRRGIKIGETWVNLIGTEEKINEALGAIKKGVKLIATVAVNKWIPDNCPNCGFQIMDKGKPECSACGVDVARTSYNLKSFQAVEEGRQETQSNLTSYNSTGGQTSNNDEPRIGRIIRDNGGALTLVSLSEEEIKGELGKLMKMNKKIMKQCMKEASDICGDLATEGFSVNKEAVELMGLDLFKKQGVQSFTVLKYALDKKILERK